MSGVRMALPLIRAVEPTDIPRITEIYGDAVRHGTASFELEPPSEAEMRGRMTGLVEAGYPYLVAELDGTVGGFAYAGPHRPRIAYRNTVEDSIYIAPEAQKRGIGRALLERLIVDCEARGFRQMLAVIGDSGNLGSIRVHEQAGFSHCGTFVAVGYKFGRWLDTVQMQRALGIGDATAPERA